MKTKAIVPLQRSSTARQGRTTDRPQLWLRRDVKDTCGLWVSPSSVKAVQVEAGISKLDKAYS